MWPGLGRFVLKDPFFCKCLVLANHPPAGNVLCLLQLPVILVRQTFAFLAAWSAFMMPFTRPDVGVGCCQAKRRFMWLKTNVFGTVFVTVNFKFLIGYINRYSKQCVPVYKLEKSLRMTQSHLRKKRTCNLGGKFQLFVKMQGTCICERWDGATFHTNRIDMAREPEKNVCHSEGCSCWLVVVIQGGWSEGHK